MSEKTQTQNPVSPFEKVEKVVAEQGARIETALAEWGKLQAKAVAQANAYYESATRVAQEQIAFAEQLGGEWRKLVLAATKSAADLFAHKQ